MHPLPGETPRPVAVDAEAARIQPANVFSLTVADDRFVCTSTVGSNWRSRSTISLIRLTT